MDLMSIKISFLGDQPQIGQTSISMIHLTSATSRLAEQNKKRFGPGTSRSSAKKIVDHHHIYSWYVASCSMIGPANIKYYSIMCISRCCPSRGPVPAQALKNEILEL